ncbi:DUF2490 domain-containing protein [Bergeyella sp. RCAD1439]|uniref:DUF2490 domain-containing protein n=1 Tax=Bergeyella anatis TaxID=3113737 RepID=UPI002E1901E3|nr:DUF2490 domain-containing protein [Bergeyella sp. RCAD1439]
MKKLALLLVFVGGLFSAQKENFDNAWFMYFGNQALSPKWNWWTEAQFRNENPQASPQQILLRTGVGLNLSENNDNLLLGYGYITNYGDGDLRRQTSSEHRIYQQFIHKSKWGKALIQHRFRTEQRFLDTNDFRLRGRYFLAANLPLSKQGMEAKSTYLSAYNEIFIVPESRVFDRNRIYLALGYVLNKNTRFEIGYMDQTVITKGQSPFSPKQNQGQIQIAIFNTLNLSR